MCWVSKDRAGWRLNLGEPPPSSGRTQGMSGGKGSPGWEGARLAPQSSSRESEHQCQGRPSNTRGLLHHRVPGHQNSVATLIQQPPTEMPSLAFAFPSPVGTNLSQLVVVMVTDKTKLPYSWSERDTGPDLHLTDTMLRTLGWPCANSEPEDIAWPGQGQHRMCPCSQFPAGLTRCAQGFWGLGASLLKCQWFPGARGGAGKVPCRRAWSLRAQQSLQHRWDFLVGSKGGLGRALLGNTYEEVGQQQMVRPRVWCGLTPGRGLQRPVPVRDSPVG